MSACRVDPAAVGIKDYQIFLGYPVGIQCGGRICADGGGFGYFCAVGFFGIPAVKAVACAGGRGQCAVGAADGHVFTFRADCAAVGIKSCRVSDRRGRDRTCSLCLIAVGFTEAARNQTPKYLVIFFALPVVLTKSKLLVAERLTVVVVLPSFPIIF